MAASLHGDVASAIGQQVEQMILQAKLDSEGRVRHDLTGVRTQLSRMEGVIADLGERVTRCSRANGGPGGVDPSQTVDREFLTQKIEQLETKWGSEVKALKTDLHRTILAHNHNSDLMRHHRDALDEARRKLDAQSHPNPAEVDAQLEKVEKMLRAGQAKQKALDALADRLTLLEAQVNHLLPGGDGLPSGFPGMMPGMPGMMGQAGLLGQAREQAAAAKKRTGKESEPPTEEEFRARFLQASRAAVAANDGSSGFNAEAPVFVPRGAPTAAESAAPEAAASLSEEGDPEKNGIEGLSAAAGADDAALAGEAAEEDEDEDEEGEGEAEDAAGEAEAAAESPEVPEEEAEEPQEAVQEKAEETPKEEAKEEAGA